LRAAAVALGEAWWWRPWEQLLHSVKTGTPAFEHVFGKEFFEYMNQDAEAAAIFNAVMTSGSTQVGVDVATAYDFSQARTVVDVGGGHGALLAAILKANPLARGILFDLPAVIKGARDLLEMEGVAERCDLMAGDFFESVPKDGDAYILKFIVHDWDDEHATAILKNCRRAMEKGKLLIVERPIPPGNLVSRGKYSDLNMLVLLRGRERTIAEYGVLFEAAGFRLTQTIPLRSEEHFSIIEGVPV
jgi:predicted O-methyltransferase YrrM